MKELKILYLYPDMLELYGDYGNIQVLKYRLEKRGFNCIVDTYSIGDEKPDFKSYDMIFAGGGADNEQSILSEDLIKYKEEIKEAENEGVFFLLICGAYQLFGKYYKDVETSRCRRGSREDQRAAIPISVLLWDGCAVRRPAHRAHAHAGADPRDDRGGFSGVYGDWNAKRYGGGLVLL